MRCQHLGGQLVPNSLRKTRCAATSACDEPVACRHSGTFSGALSMDAPSSRDAHLGTDEDE